MSDATVVKLLQPGSFADPLTEVLRNGARALLAQAIEAEVAEFLAKHADLKTASGLSRVVRHGHLPERAVVIRSHERCCYPTLKGQTLDSPLIRASRAADPFIPIEDTATFA